MVYDSAGTMTNIGIHTTIGRYIYIYIYMIDSLMLTISIKVYLVSFC